MPIPLLDTAKTELLVSEKPLPHLNIFEKNDPLAKDALHWLVVLKSYPDSSLSHKELMQKFKKMGIASTILGLTASGPLRRKYWSEQAVRYTKQSLHVLEGMMSEQDRGEQLEINTRLLIALALNYYGGGETKREILVEQFEKIPPSFLVKTGFCDNKILRGC